MSRAPEPGRRRRLPTCAYTAPMDCDDDESRARREAMVDEQLDACADPAVRAAMLAVPRHRFIPLELRPRAYEDTALAIDAGQTISQPRLVAQMLALLALDAGDRVLDIGCGSGYVSALLARLVAPTGQVYAVERQPALVGHARDPLAELAPHVHLRLGDGLLGLPEHAPYDAIHVAAACPRIPRALREQLAIGGRLVLPVGPYGDTQELMLIERTVDGWRETAHGAVRFVPGLPGVPSA